MFHSDEDIAVPGKPIVRADKKALFVIKNKIK